MAYPVSTIARQRWARGWTQQELAEKAGLSVTTIEALERGASKGSVKSVKALADVFKCDPLVLLDAIMLEYIGKDNKSNNVVPLAKGADGESETEADGPNAAEA